MAFSLKPDGSRVVSESEQETTAIATVEAKEIAMLAALNLKAYDQ